MNNLSNKSVQFLSAALLTTFIGAAYAANSNTTIQEGKVNITRTYQCGDSNDNATYQSGKVNINHTIQTCGTSNTNQTGQFGGRNFNRTRQDQSTRQARNQPNPQWAKWSKGTSNTRGRSDDRNRGTGKREARGPQ